MVTPNFESYLAELRQSQAAAPPSTMRTFNPGDFQPSNPIPQLNMQSYTPMNPTLKGLYSQTSRNAAQIDALGGQQPDVSNKNPWYMQVLDFIDRGRAGIVNPMAEVAEKGFRDADILASSLRGFSGADKGRSFQDVIDNSMLQHVPGIDTGLDKVFGWMPMYKGAGWAADQFRPGSSEQATKALSNIGVGSFAGDVALDPLTYLTLGGGSAVKIGTKATKDAAKQSAKTVGANISTKGSVTEVAERAAKAVAEASTNQRFSNLQGTVNPDLLNRYRTQMGDQIYNQNFSRAMDEILNAGRQARATAQNNLLNFDVMGTNIARGAGQKPSFMRVQDPKIGTTQANIAEQMFKDLGIGSKEASQRLGRIYNKSDVSQLSLQEFRHLMDTQLGARQVPTRGAPPARGSGDFVDFINQRPRPTTTKFDNIAPFSPDMGGASQLGNLIRSSPIATMFNARALGTGDAAVSEAGSLMRDADARKFGEGIQMQQDLEKVSNLVRNLDGNELRAIEYKLENQLPEGVKYDDLIRKGNESKVQEAVDTMRESYKRLGEADLEAGTIPGLREDYHYHSIRRDGGKEVLEELVDDPVLGKYLGRSVTPGKERTSFETMAELDNALAELKTALEKPGPPTDKTAIASKIEQLENLFERNPLKAFSNKYYQSIQTRAYAQLGKELVDTGMIVKHGSGSPIPASDLQNYIRVGGEEKGLRGQLGLKEGDRIHREVAEGLERMDKMFTNEGMENTLRGLESIMNVWKGIVTINTPSHHFTNFVGNVANNMLAGVSMDSYHQAARMLRGREGQELLEQAMNRGVLNQGFTADLGLQLESKVFSHEQVVYNNPWAKALLKGGNATDNFTRLALFVDSMNKTGSLDLAAQNVRKYLFNYREMTQADRFARFAMPFWNWTKNNLPLQIQMMAQKPRFVGTWEKLRQEFNKDYSSEELPEYIENEYWKMPGTENRFMNLRLPHQDLKGVGGPGGLSELFTGSLTPMIKSPLEFHLNRKFFNNAPIDPTRTPDTGYDLSPRGPTMDHLFSQLGMPGRLIRGGLEVTDPNIETREGETTESARMRSLKEHIDGILTGKKLELDPEKQEISNLYRLLDAQKSVIQRLQNSQR